jgi:hypothetical protein
VIATEGKRTEPEYFQMLNTLCTDKDERTVQVKCLKGHGNSPRQVLSRMKKHLRREGLKSSDEAWLVVDKDQWSPSDLDKLFQWSQSSQNYGLAVSNPCFEQWLLLHFEDCRCMSAYECIRRLCRHLPDYDKTIEPDRLVPGIQSAIQRAKRIDRPPCVDWPRSAGSTNVYRLVEKLLGHLPS